MTAEEFFAELLLPLAQARRRRGQVWLELMPEPVRETYWEAPASRTGGIEPVPLGATDGAALLERLVAWWAVEGEDWLATLAPELQALREAQAWPEEVGSSAPRLSYSAYPLF